MCSSVRRLGSSSIPGLHGQCRVQVWWTTPVQWLNLKLWVFGFARLVLHSSCTYIHFWCTRLTGAIVITDSPILNSAPISDMLRSHYTVNRTGVSVSSKFDGGKMFCHK